MRPQHSSSLSPWNIGGHRLDGPPTMAASHALPYGTLWKTRARIRRVKIGPQEREGFINRRSLRFSFLFFFVLGIPRDKGRDQFNFSLAGWIDGVEGSKWKESRGESSPGPSRLLFSSSIQRQHLQTTLPPLGIFKGL